MPEKHLPPDASLLRLARLVNGKLNGAGSVTFFLVMRDEDTTETGIIFQAGNRRGIVRTRQMLGDADADELVRSVRNWANRDMTSGKWTSDPSEAA